MDAILVESMKLKVNGVAGCQTGSRGVGSRMSQLLGKWQGRGSAVDAESSEF